MIRRSTRTRTVLGVTLQRTGRDTWSANGWTFQSAEGESLGGCQEWWAYDPAGNMTVETSLRGCVQTMKRAAAVEGR